MRIAIIGAGNVGQALATSIRRAGHEVTLAASTPESAEEKAEEVGVAPAPSNAEAARDAEVVILAVWYTEHEAVAKQLGDAVDGKVVVDVSNPVTPSMDWLATEGGPSAAERLAGLLPNARVVKAFNTIFAAVQADPDVNAITADAFVAADDEGARDAVMRLAESMGFRPIDAGPLRNARLLEALGFLGIYLNATNHWNWNTIWKLVGAPIPEPEASAASST